MVFLWFSNQIEVLKTNGQNVAWRLDQSPRSRTGMESEIQTSHALVQTDIKHLLEMVLPKVTKDASVFGKQNKKK